MKCLICGSEDFQDIMIINHRCNNCEHIFIDGPEDLEKYYNESYRKASPLPDEKIRTKFTNNILDKIKTTGIAFKGRRILEAGSADGLMSEIICKRFGISRSEMICSDLDKNMMIKCERRNFQTRTGNILDLKEKFDILFAIDILEHIKEIDKVKEWLKNFKYSVIQLPRLRGPKVFFKAHFQTFSDKSLEIFFQDFKILGRWDTKPMETCFSNGYLLVIEND